MDVQIPEARGRARDKCTSLGWHSVALLCALFISIFLGGKAIAQTTTSYANTIAGTINTTIGQACINRTFTVGTNIIIGDVDIGVLATTTTRSQLVATLTSPAGTSVVLLNNDGGTGDNLNARFDGSAATSITADTTNHNTATAPYQFLRIPRAALSAFANQNAAGTWTMEFCVSTGLSTATFTRSDLYITSIAQPVSDLSLAKTVANATPAAGAANSYTLTLSSAAGWDNAANVSVRDILPPGAVFVSATGSGGSSYNSGTGIWTIPTINAGGTQSLTINFTVNASAGATINNIAEVTSSPNFDFDSTPNDGAGDDYATRSFTVAGTRVAGTPPTLVCPAGSTLFDWDVRAWAAGSLNNSFAVTGIGNINFAIAISGGVFVNNATYGGQSPARQNVMTGGLVPAQQSLIQITDFVTIADSSNAVISLPTALPALQFRIFDVDYNAGQYADRITVTGTVNGVSVTPTLTNGVVNYVIGNTAYGDGLSADASGDGNIVVTFSSPVDTITINYGNHSLAPANPGQHATTLHDITFCNPQANLSVTKVSSITADGVSGSNPKALPGATVRYCILVTNAGSAGATNVVLADPIPANVTYVPGSALSSTSCSAATTAEDDNATGADESDPFGIDFAGTTITGRAASLAASASFAMIFNTTVN